MRAVRSDGVICGGDGSGHFAIGFVFDALARLIDQDADSREPRLDQFVPPPPKVFDRRHDQGAVNLTAPRQSTAPAPKSR